MKFHVVCDSSADLSIEIAERDNIEVVPFYVSMDGEHYLKEEKDISKKDFYQRMLDDKSCFPKTSMPSIEDYTEVFENYAKKGESVLCICLTSKFSGSYNSARNAREEVLESFPDADIYVMDSFLVTALQGLLVEEAVRLRDMGLSMEEAVPLLEEVRSTGRIFFTTKDLKYLEHGGRIGKAASMAGSVLNLKPVLTFSDGELQKSEVCRGRGKSLERVTERFFTYVEENNIDLSDYIFGTGIGADNEEYEPFKENLRKKFDEMGNHPSKWIEIRIGCTIGVHTGPYPIGLGFIKKCNI